MTLPDIFCWTKMGAEAGQALDTIIARKDTERRLGDGIFFWGIGTALGQRIWEFIDEATQPTVLFSPMKAKAKKIDVSPEKVYVWTSYLDRSGVKHPVPDHVFITSRGSTETKLKDQHYALVCRRERSLIDDNEMLSIDFAKMKNYKGNSQLGFSQVTAVVEHNEEEISSARLYDVLFSAELVEPYYVTLVDPVEIPSQDT